MLRAYAPTKKVVSGRPSLLGILILPYVCMYRYRLCFAFGKIRPQPLRKSEEERRMFPGNQKTAARLTNYPRIMFWSRHEALGHLDVHVVEAACRVGLGSVQWLPTLHVEHTHTHTHSTPRSLSGKQNMAMPCSPAPRARGQASEPRLFRLVAGRRSPSFPLQEEVDSLVRPLELFLLGRLYGLAQVHLSVIDNHIVSFRQVDLWMFGLGWVGLDSFADSKKKHVRCSG